MGELEELREMKEDVERRERAQATVIESQAKRLEQVFSAFFALSVACWHTASTSILISWYRFCLPCAPTNNDI